MSARSLSQTIVLGMILLGGIACAMRYQSRRDTQTAMEDSLWRLTYELQFSAKESLADEPDSTLRVGIPTNRNHVKLVDEEYIHTGLSEKITQYERTGNRELILTTEHGGDYTVTAEFEILLTPDIAWTEEQAMEGLTEVARRRYLSAEDELPVQSPGVQGIVRQTLKGDAELNDILQTLYEHCSNLEPPDADDGADNVDWALANKKATALGKIRAFVTLCRAARKPARLVAGFELRQTDVPRPHVWAEVFIGHRWVPFDPALGNQRVLPDNFIAIRRGSEHINRTTSGDIVQDKYFIRRLPPAKEVFQTRAESVSQIFDLTRLPVPMHEILKLMLLLPLGALITAFFRNVIGIRTFGTFAPALLAISFVYAVWGTGIVVLIVVVMAGLFGRKLLERLHLLMVPRLSIVLTMIILCLVFSVSLLDYLNMTDSGQAVLLPLVILTILIERFHVTAEEDGVAFAMQLVVGTTIVAAFCYLLLKWKYIGQLLLIYPEAHFITIALFIVIGRYSGYRLVELWRFRDLVKSDKS